MILKIVDLVNDNLHSKEIVHTNLSPQEIFLKNRSADDLCFQRLYFCQFDASKILELKGLSSKSQSKVIPPEKDNLSVFNTKVRNKDYISPE